jgi:hypothetical protein
MISVGSGGADHLVKRVPADLPKPCNGKELAHVGFFPGRVHALGLDKPDYKFRSMENLVDLKKTDFESGV